MPEYRMEWSCTPQVFIWCWDSVLLTFTVYGSKILKNIVLSQLTLSESIWRWIGIYKSYFVTISYFHFCSNTRFMKTSVENEQYFFYILDPQTVKVSNTLSQHQMQTFGVQGHFSVRTNIYYQVSLDLHCLVLVYSVYYRT